jgi:hypothetical protein
VGHGSHVFGKNNSLVKKIVLLPPKLGVKSPHIFKQSPSNVTVVCRTDCLACQDKFFLKNPVDVKENNRHVHDFALQLSHLFWSWEGLDFSIGRIVAYLRVITVNPALVTSTTLDKEVALSHKV